MTKELFLQHWALLVAGAMAAALSAFVAWRAWRDSAGGRLWAAHRDYGRRCRERSSRRRQADACTARFTALKERSDDVSPRRVEAASEDLEDARALLRIAEDQVLVAAARLREIIVEEYPPRRHEALRRRYLAE